MSDQSVRPGSDLPPISVLVRQFASGELTPLRLTTELLQRISAEDAHYRSYISVLADEALAAAQAATERVRAGAGRGPLDGVPVSIKDMLPTVQGLTTAGSRILQDYAAGYDAPLVSRLRDEGAVILGKNNMHEYAYGVTSNNQTFGRVVNPAFPGLLPGGSSGGTAAAVAAGLAVAGIGSDTGGSIRIPAACCALVGMKPSFGLVDAREAVPQAWSLDHLGPITRSVADARTVLEALMQAAPAAAGGALLAAPASAESPHKGQDSLTIGVPADLLRACTADVAGAFEQVLQVLRQDGHQIQIFDYPDWDLAYRAWLVIMLCESASYHAANLRTRPHDIDAGILPFLVAGSVIDSGRYLDAQRYRGIWCARVMQLATQFDFILGPTFPCAVPGWQDDTVQTARGMEPVRNALVEFQWMANLTGWPSISLPTALSVADGPFSVMMTMPAYRDFALLELAQRLEQQVLPRVSAATS